MENLFSGIQILSPEELESSLSASDDKVEDKSDNKDELIFSVVDDEITNEEESTTSSTQTTSSNEVIYKALIKELHTNGVITLGEAEELDKIPANSESIKKLISSTVESSLKEREEGWKKGFSGAKKRFLEIEDSFSDTDEAIFVAQKLEYLDSLSVEAVKKDEDLQKRLYFEDLKMQGFDDKKAIGMLEDAIALNKLEERSLEALPNLKKKTSDIVAQNNEKLVKQREENEKFEKESFQNLMNSIDSKEYFIQGIELNKTSKEKLKNNILNPVHKDDNGREYNSLSFKQMKNPAGFEMLINYFDVLGLFNTDKEGNFKPDISKLEKVAKSKAVSELDRVITAQNQKSDFGINTAVDNGSQESKRILATLNKAFKSKK
jgi:hypothetical protein